MELQLKQEKYFHYEPLAVRKEAQEESVETLLPDYFAEVSRVVDASGCLFVENSEISGNQLQLSANVQMTLLYSAQEEKELKTFTYSVPLKTVLELPDGNIAKAGVCGTLQLSEVRVINPRKLSTHVAVQWQISAFREAWISACNQIAEQEEYALQTLCRNYDTALIEAVRDQDFSFSDSFTANADTLQDILKTETIAQVDEVKTIGNKIAVKGSVCADVLYTTADGKIAHTTTQLPFSQIVEGVDAPEEEIEATASVCLSSAQYNIESEDFSATGRAVNARISLHLFVLLRRKRRVCTIADLYSTVYDVQSDSKSYPLFELPNITRHELPVTVAVEAGTASKPLSAQVTMGEVNQTVLADGTVQCRSYAEVRLVYLDESGTPFAVSRKQEVTLDLENGENMSVSALPVSPCGIAVVMQDDVAEVRFSVTFCIMTKKETQYLCLESVQAEKRKYDGPEEPSLVLRVLQEGEKLWDIAKQYRTTMQNILDANETEQWQDLVGKLLLIPHS